MVEEAREEVEEVEEAYRWAHFGWLDFGQTNYD
jgi:hypothetical protein